MADYIKEMLGSFIESRLENSHNLSAELMKQCVRQDRAAFDEKKLDAIDPRYKQELGQMMKEFISYKQALEDAEQRGEGDQVSRAQLRKIRRLNQDGTVDYTANLADNMRTDADRKKLSQQIDKISDLDTPVKDLTNKDIRSDIVRALGNVRMKFSEHEVTITDQFDFKGKTNSTIGLLWKAAIAKAYDGLSGPNTTALTHLGRVFCKEGPNGQSTDSSIPVKITLSTDEVGGYIPPRLPGSGPAR